MVNLTPLVVEQNCKLVGITASTDGNETWEAHVYKNGVSVAFLAITGASKGVLNNLDIDFLAGDEVRLRQQNGVGGISNPRIIAYFK